MKADSLGKLNYWLKDLLPPKLYLVVLSSEPGEPDKVNLFGLQKDLWKYFWEVLLVSYHMFLPHGGIVINVLA